MPTKFSDKMTYSKKSRITYEKSVCYKLIKKNTWLTDWLTEWPNDRLNEYEWMNEWMNELIN
jgi:hypothetical protein